MAVTSMANSSIRDFTKYNSMQGFASESRPASISSTTGSPTTGSYTDAGVTYNFYTFTGDGSLVVSGEGLADVVVIGGGGSGACSNTASFYGGGAGGGGIVERTVLMAEGTATVTIGAGGAGVSGLTPGNRGVTTTLSNLLSESGSNFTLNAWGGGGGFTISGGEPRQGGSTGGMWCGNTIQIVSPQTIDGTDLGNNGGVGTGNQSQGGGGGGGGSADGTNGSVSNGGNGGAGRAITLTGSSVTYSGGGGGQGPTGGTGGAGGGTNGTSLTASSAGGANTGGGSGAGSPSGNGGSGVVIVRVRVSA